MRIRFQINIGFLSLVVLAALLQAADRQSVGTIRGRLLDADTQAPLIGANVIIIGSNRGAATDMEGNFVIDNIPVGSYILQFTYMGYQPLTKTDVIVKSQRETYVHAETRMQTLETEAVCVTDGYFTRQKEQSVSAFNYSYEEIRRAPGSGGDVSRILMSLPSVAMVNDQSNSLIVRGGNPVENTFFVDNIEIPNINHFPDQASSGGPIGVLNVDFIRDVNFYSGGFSSIYGDKLSSVMDIRFREGNPKEWDGQLDLNFAGFGGVAEGPLGKNGSWLVSARRSYLDFVVKVLDVGSTIAPRYGDIQWKVHYDLSPENRMIFLGIWSDDHNAPDREAGLKNKMTHYGRQDDGIRTTGLTWRKLQGSRGYTQTSISHTVQNYRQDWYETYTEEHAVRNRSAEHALKLRNVSHMRLHPNHGVEFGLDGKYLWSDYNNWIHATTNALGDSIPELRIKNDLNASKAGGFINYTLQAISGMDLNIGVRADYFSIPDRLTWSPRLSLSYRITNRTTLNASGGRFYQNLPLLLISRNESNRTLHDMTSVHYILGLEYLLTENTRLTAEFYHKAYDHFPVDPSQPGLFLIDEGYQFAQSKCVDTGKAQTWGMELMVQKKLARKLYGLASVSVFKARYRGTDGLWRNRKYDNQWIFSLEGGYKPCQKWEFSLRWIAAGGGPYTPLDLDASRQYHRMVQDKNRINQARYPDYHSMNIRVDRRFSFRSSNLIFYLSVWNVYNQKNVAEYFWNDREQKQEAIYQWLIMPIFGLEHEF
ncbi:TonB-dependent receptor [bacterium]|nr:TonB-dependent receptor [bacterium]